MDLNPINFFGFNFIQHTKLQYKNTFLNIKVNSNINLCTGYYYCNLNLVNYFYYMKKSYKIVCVCIYIPTEHRIRAF